ncbi:MAG TPA: TlpA disulfide reductase family protein [Desulfuromonadales bacterium]|jgi:thiol-disulfide isomerase/thioredoxin
MRRFTVFAAILICLVAAYFYFARDERPHGPPADLLQAGSMAPDFTLKDLNGNPVTLSQLRGKVVFLNFWATWCPPCLAEMPAMERLNEVYGSQNFVMLAVNIEEDVEAVKDFLKENPHSFSVLLDLEANAQNLYGVYRFPETFLIDKNGKIVERYLGARDWSGVDFLKLINALMKE